MQGLRDKVRNILKSVDIKSAPISVEKVAEFFSIKIVPYGGFPENISGTIVEQRGHIVIGVNQNHAQVRQRFTIAHELGHYLCNHDLSEKVIDDVFDKPTDKEREANMFAAELLIPYDFIKEDIRTIKAIPELAKHYHVSEQSISIRLLETGLIHKI